MPLPLQQSTTKSLRRQIAEAMEDLKEARERQDDLGAALIEARMNELLDELKERHP